MKMKPLFEDQHQRNIGIVAVAAVAMHGMTVGKHPGLSNEEVCDDAFALARTFIEHAESLFVDEVQSNIGDVANG